jgi:Holliday junction resolvase RusA-like endonuclease
MSDKDKKSKTKSAPVDKDTGAPKAKRTRRPKVYTGPKDEDEKPYEVIEDTGPKIYLKGVVAVPILPSTNEIYGRSRSGRVFLKPEFKKFKEDFTFHMGEIHKGIKIDRLPLQLTLGFYINMGIKQKDVDNCIKIIQDSIVKTFKPTNPDFDDKLIYDLYVYKRGISGANSCFVYYKLEKHPKPEKDLVDNWDKIKIQLEKIQAENEEKIPPEVSEALAKLPV